MADNSVDLDARHDDALPERLVLAADADRRRLERDLHEGVQQQLVALAVNVQLAQSLLESDPAGAAKLLQGIGRDVQDALNEAARLAQRIYPPLLELGGFAAALRSAAVTAGVSASVDVTAGSDYPREVMNTIYLSWVEALEHGSTERPVTISVREEAEALTFAIRRDADAALASLRDRVRALGGELKIEPLDDGGVRLVGSLPLSR